MNNKEEISVQHLFNTANERLQKVLEMLFQSTTALHSTKPFLGEGIDLFQCNQLSREPHTTSCSQHSRRPNVTFHQECSAQPMKLCLLRSSNSRPPHQDIPWTSNNPTRKTQIQVRCGENGHEKCCVQDEMCGPREGWSH
ncbi:hypothetical protein AVEN_128259-1 [Araneus ventricosus]|uniref:Uncharacterized protein n=1 Tax=Araneus ventricosus TaxID=182803 RepID=A0A4Y2SQ80_ARAVE|nr:hypothetical protein AVEN_128259-1 [Araneus ventricosus]